MDFISQIFTLHFLSALGAIVVIDLVLAGDNAIVIALATRKLPQRLRKVAIMWGTVGAVIVRTLLTAGVVWLLQVPGLMLAGGAMLVWIAWKLLADQGDEDKEPDIADGFWAAIKTIVVADLVMGLDNVLAVAGAAHGSFLLVTLGLLISIPIVVWGSTLILKLVDRFPSIIYIGAGVLAWTAAKMIVSEPLVVAQLAGYSWVNWIIYALVFAFVLGGGYWANRAAAQKTGETALAPKALSAPRGLTAPTIYQEETSTMSKILVPVDGTANAMQAARFAVKTALDQGNIEVHLLHVRAPLPQHMARFLKRGERASWNAAEAERALSHARGLLMNHGIPFAEHIERGDPAHTIDRVARRLKVDQIVIGHSSIPLVGRLFRRSVTTTLTELTRVPVQVIAGERGTLLARWGIPAGVGALIALLLVASD